MRQILNRNKTESGWGPNAVFRFPQRGGTGAIWKGVAALLPTDRQRYNTEVVHIDADEKTVTLKDGSKIGYNKVYFPSEVYVILYETDDEH